MQFINLLKQFGQHLHEHRVVCQHLVALLIVSAVLVTGGSSAALAQTGDYNLYLPMLTSGDGLSSVTMLESRTVVGEPPAPITDEIRDEIEAQSILDDPTEIYDDDELATKRSFSVSYKAELMFRTQVNSYRMIKNLPRFRRYIPMEEAARAWTEDMANRDVLEHSNNITENVPDGWSSAGENVGKGGTIASLMRKFKESPGHNSNLLNPAYTHFGIGAGINSRNVMYTTHRFASVPGLHRANVRTPIGKIRKIEYKEDNKIRIVGWTIDPDVADPINVTFRLYTDTGAFFDGGTYLADKYRKWMLNYYPDYGGNHFFAKTITLPNNNITKVCVVGHNVSRGSGNPEFHCMDMP